MKRSLSRIKRQHLKAGGFAYTWQSSHKGQAIFPVFLNSHINPGGGILPYRIYPTHSPYSPRRLHLVCFAFSCQPSPKVELFHSYPNRLLAPVRTQAPDRAPRQSGPQLHFALNPWSLQPRLVPSLPPPDRLNSATAPPPPAPAAILPRSGLAGLCLPPGGGSVRLRGARCDGWSPARGELSAAAWC